MGQEFTLTEIIKMYFTETSSLPTVCQRSRCLRDAVAKTHYCAAHQPKPKAPPAPWKGMPVVYVVGVEGEPYAKIGFASELSARMTGLQTSSPKQLIIHCVLEGSLKVEAILHREMQDHAVRGEWFDIEPVKALCAKLEVCRYTRMRLRVEAVVCTWSDQGYPWDTRGLPKQRMRDTILSEPRKPGAF